MNWKRAAIPAIVVLPLLVILGLSFGNDPHKVPFVLENKPAPDFSLTTLTGQPMSLTMLRGKPVIINFWSTWCEPCKWEHDLLQDASRFYKDKIQFIGIIYQDDAEKADAYLKTKKSFYPQLVDATSATAIDYGVSGVPESFFITSDGTLLHKHAGPIDNTRLNDQIQRLLGNGKEQASAAGIGEGHP